MSHQRLQVVGWDSKYPGRAMLSANSVLITMKTRKERISLIIFRQIMLISQSFKSHISVGLTLE